MKMASHFCLKAPISLKYDRPIKTNASVIEHGAMNAIGFAALATSLDIIQRLGIGNINTHVQKYHDGLERICVSHGFFSHRAPMQVHRSGILSFTHPDFQLTQGSLSFSWKEASRALLQMVTCDFHHIGRTV